MNVFTALRVELETLEYQTNKILTNLGMTLSQKRARIRALFKRYELVRRALIGMLTAYRILTERSPRPKDTEKVVADLLAQMEFEMLSLFLLALLMFAGEPWGSLPPFPRLAVPGYPGLVPSEDELGNEDEIKGSAPRP